VNRLFIELYLDEDVDVLVADLLQARGFIAVTTRDAWKRQTSDAEQLAYAVSREMTHNRAHFQSLHEEYASTGQPHYGIIVATRHPPHEIVRRLLRILNHVTADEMQNQLRYI
jgi:hypothetical protein